MWSKCMLAFRIGWLISGACVLISCSDSSGPDEKDWNLVWQDEFDGPAGELPNTAVWNFDIGTDWGNAQLEYDTDRAENISTDGDGNLAIVAREEAYLGQAYTSGRISTKDKFEITYGRIEARMLMPWGQGLWPAFWMLGANIDEVIWPGCGEIDIMEYRGQEPFRIHGSLHGPGYSGGNPVTAHYDLANARFDTDFHIFAVEWNDESIKFYVDDVLYQTVEPDDVSGDWVYDHDFFIILNLAVGGHYVGWPDETTQFPQTLLIDYVRVFEAD